MWIGTNLHIITGDQDFSIAGLTVFTSTSPGTNAIFNFTVSGGNYTYTAKNVTAYDFYNEEKGLTWPAGASYTFGHTDTSFTGNWHIKIKE